MLIGLLRMRLKAGSVFGLAHILWKQVGWWQRSLAVIALIFVSKGLIWLLLAIVAEVPTSVRLVITLATFFLLIAISCYRRS